MASRSGKSRWGVTTNGYRFLLEAMKIFKNYIIVMVTHSKYQKNHLVVLNFTLNLIVLIYKL